MANWLASLCFALSQLILTVARRPSMYPDITTPNILLETEDKTNQFREITIEGKLCTVDHF
jgi:hypothetical protein